MTRFNFKEACLLDASGELGASARKQFLNYIRENPAALQEYEEIREDFQRLEGLPLPELSALQRREIPMQMKQALAHAMQQQQREKQAARRHRLIRWACAGVASAAAAVIVMASVMTPAGAISPQRQREQIARINSAVDHLAGFDRTATPYELALTDVEASIRQLQTESPTISAVYDKNMGNLLDALAMEPMSVDDSFLSEPLPSPGSL